VGASFSQSDLSHANLRGANLVGARFLETNLEGADLSESSIYGVAVWDVRLTGAQQSDLVISPHVSSPTITVDSLEVAQFIYLLLANDTVRRVIDSITSKVVLILGRFTEARKPVLDAIRHHLRNKDYVPVIFDFDKPATRDTEETITLLARMARFIVADV